ncbi:hypothetical protein ACS5PJ_19820 [Pseudarthrobacter sp. YS3]|uniref:hypothetical protein n=1 Tax=Pseudarthrobacter sp. YS3 TaxID=3453718 RepID=UPI003EEFB87A
MEPTFEQHRMRHHPLDSGAMTSRISQVLNDPRDPEEILRALSAQELRSLTDALYRTLDTPSPAPGTETWYELAVEEAIRRSASELTASAGGAQETTTMRTKADQVLPTTRSAETPGSPV